MTLDDALDAVARRDRVVALTALVAITALGWVYLFRERAGLSDMADMVMADTSPWSARELALAIAMWAVMMIAMMLPSAAPMILTFVTLNRKRRATGETAGVHTAIFTFGYLLAWTTFGVLAALGQAGLRAYDLLGGSMTVASTTGGALLVGAGVYQLTPLKYACLSRCRTPLGFLMSEWRDGRTGALSMGIRHGLFCVGCCWTLMLLLFAVGVMNLAWVAVIAGFVLLEKIVPAGRAVSWIAGAMLIVWGTLTLARVL